MNLTLDVTTADGETEQVTIDLFLSPSQTVDVTRLVGPDALVELASGGWNRDAARAIMFVKLAEQGIDIESPDLLDLAWDEDDGRDPELEASLSMKATR